MTYPEPSNLTTFPEMMRYANTVTDSVFGVGILLSFYLSILFFFITRGGGVQKSATASGLATTVIGILFLYLDVIGQKQFFFTVALFAIPVLWAYFSPN